MTPDVRNIVNGSPIPRELYSDQPYLVKAADGSWLCVITTANGLEGAAGEHVGITRSLDRGQTWSPLYFLEGDDARESAYGVLLKVPYGRIYCFYNFNKDNLRTIECSEDCHHRVDLQGHFVFRYSDDSGINWSPRYEIPIRETQIDRENPYGGKIKFFWTVAKPFLLGDIGHVIIHKIGDVLTISEGWLLRCANMGNERDPGKFVWETLPDGDVGLRTPKGGGKIAEEQSMVCLSDGSLYCVYRTVDGHPTQTCSRDGGHTWDSPQYLRYDDGRLVKHPRAANFIWKCGNGKFLYWYHNNGGKWYQNRNPVWICGGIEADSPAGKTIRWSQPELLLYDDDPYVIISYPDLIEDGGCYYITETQKLDARVHPIPNAFLERLWNQFDCNTPAMQGLLGSYKPTADGRIMMPVLPEFTVRDPKSPTLASMRLHNAFTFEFWCDVPASSSILLDSRDSGGKGILVELTPENSVKIMLNDGMTENAWASDAFLTTGLHHIGIVVDGGPRIISFVIDGHFCDGGEKRVFGFGRFSPDFRDVNTDNPALLGENVALLRIYDRALMTTEIIGNYRAGLI